MRIGELLVEQRKLRQSELARALSEKPADKRLVSFLIARGLVDFDDASRALGEQKGVPSALSKHLAGRDPELANLIPAELGRASCALPIGRTSQGAVIVCVRDPAPAVLTQLRRATNAEIIMVVAPANRLEHLVLSSYGAAPSDELDIDFSTTGMGENPVMNPPSVSRAAAKSALLPPEPDMDALDPESVRLALTDLDDVRVDKDPTQSGTMPKFINAPTPPPPTAPPPPAPTPPAPARAAVPPPRATPPTGTPRATPPTGTPTTPPARANTPASGTPTRANTPATGTPTRATTPATGTPTRATTPATGTPTRATTPATGTPTRATTPATGTPTRATTPATGTPTRAATPATATRATTPATGVPTRAATPPTGTPTRTATPPTGTPTRAPVQRARTHPGSEKSTPSMGVPIIPPEATRDGGKSDGGKSTPSMGVPIIPPEATPPHVVRGRTPPKGVPMLANTVPAKKRAQSEPRVSDPKATRQMSLDMMSVGLEHTTTREGATDLVLAYVATRWISALVLAIRDDTADGFRGHGVSMPDLVSIPIGMPSTLQRAVETKGVATDAPNSGAQASLLRALEGPRAVAAAPVVVKGQVVAVVVVGDPLDRDASVDYAAADLGMLADALSTAFSRIASR